MCNRTLYKCTSMNYLLAESNSSAIKRFLSEETRGGCTLNASNYGYENNCVITSVTPLLVFHSTRMY